jgi:hypothetical protein
MNSSQPRAELRLRSLDEHGWTWCYVEPGTDVELYSNETYASPEEAREWARRAYPDLSFGEADDVSPPVARVSGPVVPGPEAGEAR